MKVAAASSRIRTRYHQCAAKKQKEIDLDTHPIRLAPASHKRYPLGFTPRSQVMLASSYWTMGTTCKFLQALISSPTAVRQRLRLPKNRQHHRTATWWSNSPHIHTATTGGDYCTSYHTQLRIGCETCLEDCACLPSAAVASVKLR